MMICITDKQASEPALSPDAGGSRLFRLR